MTPPVPVMVALKDLDLDRLRQHAVTRHEVMVAGLAGSGERGTKGSRSMPYAYGRSTPRMHEVGLTGEYALSHWLDLHHCANHLIGDDSRTAGDVAVVRHHPSGGGSTAGGVGTGEWVSDWVTFEVKTSRERDWPVYERSLDAAQLARCTANAYVWAVLADQWGTSTVRLIGWLPVDDIRGPTAAPDATRPSSVHGRPHVRVITPVRPMHDLIDWTHRQPSIADYW